jgi:1,4-alpha-glucan branching enzyme
MNKNHDSVGCVAQMIKFHYDDPKARTVYLIGDFNGWDSTCHLMQREVNGNWLLQLLLGPGRHHYQFVVDGKPKLDPHAIGVVHHERKEQVSLIAVS